MFKNLQELTGQESGIVLYENGGVVCNWSSIDGYPRVFVNNVMGLGDDIPGVANEYRSENLSVLIDVDLIDCGSGDSEIPEAGQVYELEDGVIVIAPDDWA